MVGVNATLSFSVMLVSFAVAVERFEVSGTDAPWELRSYDSTFDRRMMLGCRVTILTEPGASPSLCNNNWVCSVPADTEE